MEDIYKEKYLKYKAKYLALKNLEIKPQVGGRLFEYPWLFVDPSLNNNSTNQNTAQLYINVKLKNDCQFSTSMNRNLAGIDKPAIDDFHITLLVLRLSYNSAIYNALKTIYFPGNITFFTYYRSFGMDVDDMSNNLIPVWNFYNPNINRANMFSLTMKDIFNQSIKNIFTKYFNGIILDSSDNNYDCFANNNFVKIFNKPADVQLAYSNFKLDLFYLFRNLILAGSRDPPFNSGQEPSYFNYDDVTNVRSTPGTAGFMFTHYWDQSGTIVEPLHVRPHTLFAHSMYFDDDRWTPHITILPKDAPSCSNEELKKSRISEINRYDNYYTNLMRTSQNPHNTNMITLLNYQTLFDYSYELFDFNKFDVKKIANIDVPYYVQNDRWGYLESLGFVKLDEDGNQFRISKDKLKEILISKRKPSDDPNLYLFLSTYLGIAMPTKEINTNDLESINFNIFMEGQNSFNSIVL